MKCHTAVILGLDFILTYLTLVRMWRLANKISDAVYLVPCTATPPHPVLDPKISRDGSLRI